MVSDKIAYRLIIGLAAFSAVGLAFFGIAALVSPASLLSPGEVITDGAVSFAQYMAGRNLGIATLMIVALALRNRTMLGYFLLLNGLIQAFDAVLGIKAGEVARTVAPIFLCVTNLAASRYLLSDAVRKA